MFNDETPEEWNGIPIKIYNSNSPLECPDVIYKLAYDWDNEEDSEFSVLFPKYLTDPKCAETIGLKLGLQSEMAEGFYSECVEVFLENATNFPKLKWLYLGDMEQEESELTWIEQGDVGSPVLSKLPLLEALHARGGEGSMTFSKASHSNLKELVLQPGGFDKEMFKNVITSDFPELEVLELWLGSEERGADVTADDIRDLLEGNPFPKLKVLRLMNSEITTNIAKDIANAPILDQIEELDLSMGTLKDDGGLALLASDKIKSLKSLNLCHHYMTTDIMNQFNELNINVDVSEQEVADEWDDELHYYVSVSE